MDRRIRRRLERERRTIRTMVGMYCEAHHGEAGPAGLCVDCREFMAYAGLRLEKCPYGETKPTCANCPIHCYKPERRRQAKAIMRYAGPRMLLRHPLLAVLHRLDGMRKPVHPRELTRTERLASRRGPE